MKLINDGPPTVGKKWPKIRLIKCQHEPTGNSAVLVELEAPSGERGERMFHAGMAKYGDGLGVAASRSDAYPVSVRNLDKDPGNETVANIRVDFSDGTYESRVVGVVRTLY